MKQAHPKSPIAPHRPKFRLFAATIMLGLIVAGTMTMLLGAWVVVRETAIRMNITRVSTAGSASGGSRGMVALGWAFLNQQNVFTLIGAATVMLLLALLLRAIVLNGLRD